MTIETHTAEDVEWPELQRVRRAIVVVDVVESVRLMQQHETDVINRWRKFVSEVQNQVLPKHGGRLVKHLGDGMLLEFESVLGAVYAALDILHRITPYNAGREASAAIELRMGAHVAEVVIDELDVFGDGVNLAARLASLAAPQSIVVSAPVRDQVQPDLDADVKDLGECHLKHFAQPVRAYRLRPVTVGNALPDRSTRQEDLRPTLAVLPFDVRSTEGGDAFVGDMLADELIAVLSRGAPLRVISRLSTGAVRARGMDVSQLGTVLGANYVLSGRVQTNGSQVKVWAELADARAGSVMFARSLSADVRDLVTMGSGPVDELASAVCDSIVRHELSRARHLPLPTLDSYALLLAGVSLMHRFSTDDFARAQTYLEALVERVPRHAAPYAWLARWHVFRVVQGWSSAPEKDRGRALDLSKRALDLDPESPIALTVAGSVQVSLMKNLDTAQEFYRDALKVNPSEPLAWLLLGTVHTFLGDGEGALKHAEQAAQLSPLDPMRFFYDSHAAAAALTAERFDKAITLARRSLKANRMFQTTYRSLAIAQSLCGLMDDARETVKHLLTMDRGLTVHSFLAQSPAGEFPHAKRFAEALREAGLPPGHAAPQAMSHPITRGINDES